MELVFRPFVEGIRFGRSRLEHVILSLIAVSTLLFALPRVDVRGLPYNISGVDLTLVPLSLGLSLALWYRRGVYWHKSLPAFLAFIPVLLFLSNLIPGMLEGQNGVFLQGTLQAIRRTPAVLMLLLLLQIPLSRHDRLAILKLLMVAVLLGGVLGQIVEMGLVPGVDLPAIFGGGGAYLVLKDLGLDQLADIVHPYRLSGLTGSPTTFCMLCIFVMILAIGLHQRRHISLAATLLFIGPAILMYFETFSKSGLIVGLLAVIVMLVRYRTGIVLAPLICCAIVGTLVALPTDELFRLFIIWTEMSLTGRLSTWTGFMRDIEANPYIILFGAGYRTAPVGLHNEFLEYVRGMGLFVGAGLFVLCYFYLPWKILKFKMKRDSIIGHYEFLIILSVIFGCSLFQDVFLDVSIIFFMCIVVAIMSFDIRESIEERKPANPSPS